MPRVVASLVMRGVMCSVVSIFDFSHTNLKKFSHLVATNPELLDFRYARVLVCFFWEMIGDEWRRSLGLDSFQKK